MSSSNKPRAAEAYLAESACVRGLLPEAQQNIAMAIVRGKSCFVETTDGQVFRALEYKTLENGWVAYRVCETKNMTAFVVAK